MEVKENAVFIPVNEQETTVNFSRDGEKAVIWTSDKTVMTKLDKLVGKSGKWKCTEEQRIAGSDSVVAKTYETVKRLISFRADTVSRELTEEQRKEMGERLRRKK